MTDYDDNDSELLNNRRISLDELKSSKNLTSLLDETELATIGSNVITGYEIDEKSRAEWMDLNRKGMDVAMQRMEAKNHPWPNCSNIKFPLIAEAASSYAARTVPEIIQNDRIVKALDTGNDPDNSVFSRGMRVATCMSYQLISESPDWVEGLTHSLYCLPVVGTIFKKTYYDIVDKRFISEMCTPDKVVVNNGISNLSSAPRITQIVERSTNYILERQRQGVYNEDIDADDLNSISNDNDYDAPVELLEQHCWMDLDGDGYKEPYVVIVHKDTQKVLRIANRFDEIVLNDKKEVVKITAEEYFIDYHFIKSFDGSFYSIGFGTYLLPLNAAASSLINQLIDAGTLSITQAGFLGKGLRVKDGEIGFKMGQWRVLDAASGTDISKSIYPLPVREPSETLFKLLQLIIQTCKDLSSTTDATQGKQPVQNVAQGSAAMNLEQANKSFVAINKGIYRSLSREFSRLYDLNYKYLDNNQYKKILNDPSANKKEDFKPGEISVRPVADPTMSSDSQRLNKASILQHLPTVDRRAADVYMATAMQVDLSEMKALFPPPPPQPAPEVQKIMAEIQLMQAQTQEIMGGLKIESDKNQLAAQKIQLQMQQTEAFVQESMARINKMMADAADKQAKTHIMATKVQTQADMHVAEFEHKKNKDQADIAIKAEDAQTRAAKVGTDAALGTAQLAIEKDKNDKIPKERNANEDK
jgi:chaperonin GroES